MKVADVPAEKVDDDLGKVIWTWVAKVRFVPRSMNQPAVIISATATQGKAIPLEHTPRKTSERLLSIRDFVKGDRSGFGL